MSETNQPAAPTVDALIKQIGGEHANLKGLVGTLGSDMKKIGDDLAATAKALADLRTAQLNQRHIARVRPPGGVSERAAMAIGSRCILLALAAGALDIRGADRDRLEGVCKDALDIQVKTTLSTSDIPQITEYGSEVKELVGEYGLARRVGTVYPMGADTVKLPYLTTDPAFTLIGSASAVTEKSPGITQGDLIAKKFGGLVRFGREIDAGAVIGLGQFLARYGARNFALIEDTVFFTADGTGTYGSLTGLTKAVDASATRVVQASTKTANSEVTAANLRDLRSMVSSGALRNGAYYMHNSFEKALTGFNTSGDKPYRNEGLRYAEYGTGGRGALSTATFDGFPIIWVDVLPALSTSAAASTISILFGDASYNYLGDRMMPEIALSEQALWTTDEVAVRFLERISVLLLASQSGAGRAIAGLKTAAS